jgi:hypothetical protein
MGKRRKRRSRDTQRARIMDQCAFDGYVVTASGDLEHRVLYKKYGGKIPKGWVVHHINEVKWDNRLENLIALPSNLHTALHCLQREQNIRFTKEQLEQVVRITRKRQKEILVAIKQLKAEFETAGIGELMRVSADSPPAPAPEKGLGSVIAKKREAPRVILRKASALTPASPDLHSENQNAVP